MSESLFKTTDTGSEVFILDGDPIYLYFNVGSSSEVKVTVAEFLEIFRLTNAIWYSNLINRLNICFSGFCINTPLACHVRISTCPTQTEYEQSMIVEYNNRMRKLHMETKRAPIPDGIASHSPSPNNPPSIDSDLPRPNED